VQQMRRLTLRPDGSIHEETFDTFSFVPLLGGKNS
jgi:hypothetical protein